MVEEQGERPAYRPRPEVSADELNAEQLAQHGASAPLPDVVAAPKADRFGACIPHILANEGGFVNHPSDPGGATNRGITHRTLAAWRGEPVTVADVRALDEDEARAIYKSAYWSAARCDDLPAGVDLCVFDACVNSGQRRAVQWLQEVVGTKPDGAIGPVTLAAVLRQEPAALVRAYQARRMTFLRGLETWPTFGRGWTRRVSEIETTALAMVEARAGAVAEALG